MKKTIIYYRSSEGQHIKVVYEGAKYGKNQRAVGDSQDEIESNLEIRINGDLFTNYSFEERCSRGDLAVLKESLQGCKREKVPIEELTRRVEHVLDKIVLEPQEYEEEHLD